MVYPANAYLILIIENEKNKSFWYKNYEMGNNSQKTCGIRVILISQ
jgi:hypothetical protein